MQTDAFQDEARVLVVAPTARDARLSHALLTQAGLACVICPDLAAFGNELGRGAGAVVLTEEALAPGRWPVLIAALTAQPIWSDLPIILLTSSPAQVLRSSLVRQLGNVLVLERPISMQLLLSVVHMALRTRRRQYAARIVAEAGLLLAGSLVDDGTLAAVGALLVPRLADCCMLYTLDTVAPRLAAVAFAPAAQHEELRMRGVMADVAREAHFADPGDSPSEPPEDHTAYGQALVAVIALAEAHLQLLDVTERQVLPLQTHAGVHGALSLGMLSAGRTFTPEDRQVAQVLADRVAVALDQARLYRALRISRDTLEARVQERTAALVAANQILQDEITQRKRVEAERAALLERVLMVQEAERLRIARDLHDQLGQQITGLLLRLKQLEEPAQGTAVAPFLPPIQALARDIAKEAHRIAVNLRPTALEDVGLVPALERLVDDWGAQAGIPTALQSFGLEQQRLPRPIEVALFRVVQEALTNIQKHAGATNVGVIIEQRDQQVVVVVEDNGCGFAAEEILAADGRPRLGLLGMRERVTPLGGTLDIEASPGSGTTVFVRIPLSSQR